MNFHTIAIANHYNILLQQVHEKSNKKKSNNSEGGSHVQHMKTNDDKFDQILHSLPQKGFHLHNIIIIIIINIGQSNSYNCGAYIQLNPSSLHVMWALNWSQL